MASTIAPAYVDDYHHIHATTSSNRGALIRQPPPVIEEPVVEHEHHHLHHHIDHGSVAPPRSVVSGIHTHRPSVGRQYSYDDLDVRERRYTNGTTVSHVHHAHAHDGSRRRRHRHRRRSGRYEEETTRYTRSEIDLALHNDIDYHHDDVTIVDVPPGTRRLKVNIDQGSRRDSGYDIDWRREQGIRRSRGLGNELWTEITKDLISRESLEELGYQFEETDYFFYVFEYLDKDEISELRELTEDLRRERVRELQYESIAGGSQRMSSVPRIMAMPTSSRVYERDIIDNSDTRTEIIIENGSSRGGGRSYRRGRYYN